MAWQNRKISMIPEFLRTRKTYILMAIIVTILGVLSLSFAYFRAQTTNQPTNSTVMVETVDIAGNVEQFTVYYDNNDGFFETGILNITDTYTDMMKFRVVSSYNLGSQNISINWKSVKSTLTKENTSYDLYSCSSSNYTSATIANVASLCTKISPTSSNYLPGTDEKTRLTSASDITLSASTTNCYIATINIPVSESGKSFDGSISVKHNADHILTLNLDGGSLDSTTSMTLGTGDTITIPGPTKAGYMVTNWATVCTECQVNGMEFTMGTSDATITAEWVTDTYNYDYNGTTGTDGSYQIFTALQTGIYKIEAWGAQGGNGYQAGGYGAYTSGEIYLEKDEKLFVYIGGQGRSGSSAGGYNGGGTGGGGTYQSGGGGATDIRYFSSNPTAEVLDWNSTLGLNSRIMVAAGGGGGGYTANNIKHGGGLTNYDGTSTQTFGNSFGIGGNGSYSGPNSAPGGGGGGYWGGYAHSTYDVPGKGGTSYISGHNGCDSIYNSTSRVYTGNSVHYSNKYFINTVIHDGMSYVWTNIKGSQVNIPNPTGGVYSLGTGRTGSGFARISFINYAEYTAQEIENNVILINSENNYSYSSNYQIFTALQTGIYKIEAWGAQGGNGYQAGGYGAYTSGEIYLEKDEKLFVYIGGQGRSGSSAGGYNGGGTGGGGTYQSGGGGATDIRYFSSTPTSNDLAWNSVNGLNSRIMVAAGGGGGGYDVNSIKHAGGLANSDLTSTQAYGSSFGIGGNGSYSGSNAAPGGGGGGYYGGVAYSTNNIPGNGGTSYVSGHVGCNSIEALTSRVHIGFPIHFTNKYFINTIMIDGMGYFWEEIKGVQQLMPNYRGGQYTSGTGNTGNGYARITFVSTTNKSLSEINNEINIIKSGANFPYSGSYQVFTTPKSGKYIIEAWGAQGGKGYQNGGYGAYSRGEINLTIGTKLYIYVGGRGSSGTISGGYNGGGNGGGGTYQSGGGGATDIRYFSTTPSSSFLIYNNYNGLNARIMVAGGGGGGGYSSNNNKHAGGLFNSTNLATQTTGASFGIGGNGSYSGSNSAPGGGGGGWYGGPAYSTYDIPGNGGSCYISGHDGSIAIANLFDSVSPRTHLSNCIGIACSYHLTTYKFTNTIMIDGLSYLWTNAKGNQTNMPNPWGGTYGVGTGQIGNGFARIFFVE